jgi:hypothetical protein
MVGMLMQVRANAAVPTSWMDDDEVRVCDDYSIRAPTDYVVSGPIMHDMYGTAPKYCRAGRVFRTADLAEEWARNHFGARFRYRINDAERGGRWAMLVARG